MLHHEDSATATETSGGHTQPCSHSNVACSSLIVRVRLVGTRFSWQVTKGFVICSHSSEDGPNEIVDEKQRRNASLLHIALPLRDSGSRYGPRVGSEELRAERYPNVSGRDNSGRGWRFAEEHGGSGTALGWRGLAHIDKAFIYNWNGLLPVTVQRVFDIIDKSALLSRRPRLFLPCIEQPARSTSPTEQQPTNGREEANLKQPRTVIAQRKTFHFDGSLRINKHSHNNQKTLRIPSVRAHTDHLLRLCLNLALADYNTLQKQPWSSR